MSRVLQAGVVLAAAGAVFILCAAISSYSKGTTAFDALPSQQFDSGELRAGEIIRHTFQIHNPNATPLIFDKMKKSCGCLLVQSPPARIEPGQTAAVTVAVDTKGFFGPFMQQAALVFKDHDPIQLTVRGTAIAAHPELVDFGRVLRGEGSVQVVEVKAMSSQPLELSDLRYDARYFHVETCASEANSRDQVLRIRLRDDIPFGHFRADLEFVRRTDSVERSQIRLWGYVVRPVEVEPQRLLFGIVSKDDKVEGKARIFSPYGHTVFVRTVQPGTAWISHEPPVQVAESEIEIPLVLAGGFSDKVFRGDVRVHAEADGVLHELNIECYALKAEP